MISNSKLTKLQKATHKEMLGMLTSAMGGIVTSNSGAVTVVWMPEFVGSRMVRVSVSVASPSERKIRAKVGEYHALDKLFNCEQFITVPNGVYMWTLAGMLDDH